MQVSIIIPVYNAAPYIERCAISLFEQTYKDIEFIFVNDCSTDISVQILKKTIDNYQNRIDSFILLENQVNQGSSITRKIGLEKATGDYVIFADSDDFLELDMIEKMVKKAIENSADIVWCEYNENHYKNVNHVKINEDNNFDKINIFKQILASKLHASTWNKLIKKNIFLNTIFPKASQLEDFVIAIQNIYFAEKIIFLHEPLYNYVIRKNSLSLNKNITSKRNREAYENMLLALNFFRDKFKESLDLLEPELSYRINHVKMKIMETAENRDIKKLYELYPESLNKIIIKSKSLSYIFQAILLFLATKNILFPYKIVDLFRNR